MRNYFQIDEASPLFDKRLRNAVEHFDERLDLYLQEGIAGYIFPSMVLASRVASEVPHHIFRAYYMEEGEFELLGESFKIQPIFRAVQEVHRTIFSRP